MATLTDIVNRAFRESGITQIGTTPNADEFSEALTILYNLIDSVYNYEVGEPFVQYTFGDNGVTKPDANALTSDVLPANAQVNCNLSSAKTFYLPPTPDDGAFIAIFDSKGNFSTYNLTLNGNGRKIDGAASVTLSTNSTQNGYMYRADNGQWTLFTSLNELSDFPLRSRFEELFVIWLAMRINPRYGASLAPEQIAEMNRLKGQLRSRYRQVSEQGSEFALTRLPSGRYLAKADFNKGS